MRRSRRDGLLRGLAAGLVLVAGLALPMVAPQPAQAVPPGTYAYVANFSADTVSVIDTATNAVVVTVPVGDAPWGVAVSPDGTRAYVTNANDDTVSVVDTATNTVVATVAVEDLPFGVAIGVVPRRAPALSLIKLTAGETFTRGGRGTYTLTLTVRIARNAQAPYWPTPARPWR
ncbi:YncE family protein [Streptomyces erythrochromogenes]|uniref:YncE family protein n=1 Tax=Streptomyces erythrochromogenes TaxID=285574 RepID=UPI0037F9A0B1